MAQLLLVSTMSGEPGEVLPALGLLPHSIRVIAPSTDALGEATTCDLIVLDGRGDLVAMKNLCDLFRSADMGVPLLLLVVEGAVATLTPDWGIGDFILDGAGPAEVDARVRLLLSQTTSGAAGVVSSGPVVINENSYSAVVAGDSLDLTYTEFELLRYLVQHPKRVFSREHLLSQVWGYDYYGGTRTVDVHIRRLRAKLGSEHENLIGTVRNVGYLFSPRD